MGRAVLWVFTSATHMSLIENDLQLAAHIQRTDEPLNEQTTQLIYHQTMAVLREKNPLLANTVELRVARQGQNNYINLRIRRQFSNMLYHVMKKDLAYCFFASDKLDSTVIVIVLSVKTTSDPRLRCVQSVDDLSAAVSSFLEKMQLQPTGYSYTTENERKDPTLSHSRHFHLKIHLDWASFAKVMPTAALYNTEILHKLDPVRYNVLKSQLTWQEAIMKIRLDNADPA